MTSRIEIRGRLLGTGRIIGLARDNASAAQGGGEVVVAVDADAERCGGTLSLYRAAGAWTLLEIATKAAHRRPDEAVQAHTVVADEFTDLSALKSAVLRNHGHGAWHRLLTATHHADADLHAEWVPLDLVATVGRVATDINTIPLVRLEEGLGGAALRGFHAQLRSRGYTAVPIDEPPASDVPVVGAQPDDKPFGTVLIRGWGYEGLAVVVIDGRLQACLRLADPARYPIKPTSD